MLREGCIATWNVQENSVVIIERKLDVSKQKTRNSGRSKLSPLGSDREPLSISHSGFTCFSLGSFFREARSVDLDHPLNATS